MATALAILAVVTAISLLTASSDRGLVTSAFAQGVSPKMHLEEGIKSLKSGDNQGALMHLGIADKTLGGTGG